LNCPLNFFLLFLTLFSITFRFVLEPLPNSKSMNFVTTSRKYRNIIAPFIIQVIQSLCKKMYVCPYLAYVYNFKVLKIALFSFIYFYKHKQKKNILKLLLSKKIEWLWFLTPLSTTFQLYRGGQFYWRRREVYPENEKIVHFDSSLAFHISHEYIYASIFCFR
jgi:hypothetical protein